MTVSMNGGALDLVVIGCGYVGLPLVIEASRSGLACAGLDTNDVVVTALMSGHSHIDDVSDDDVQSCVDQGTTFTTDPAVLASAAATVICVPTPLNQDRSPDLRFVLQATADIRDHLSAGQLVVLESTTYPGTTDGLVRDDPRGSPDSERVSISTLPSPPNESTPAIRLYGLRNTPKVVGGLTRSCTERATVLYGQFVDGSCPSPALGKPRWRSCSRTPTGTSTSHWSTRWPCSATTWASTSGRSFGRASTKPFGFKPFYPGPGVGGHCIPIDPNYLSHSVCERSATSSASSNSHRRSATGCLPYVAARVQNMLNEAGKPLKGSRILLLGVAYKADISDERETPAAGDPRAARRLGPRSLRTIRTSTLRRRR